MCPFPSMFTAAVSTLLHDCVSHCISGWPPDHSMLPLQVCRLTTSPTRPVPVAMMLTRTHIDLCQRFLPDLNHGSHCPYVIWLNFDCECRQVDLSRRFGGKLTSPNVERNRLKSTSKCLGIEEIQLIKEITPDSIMIRFLRPPAWKRSGTILVEREGMDKRRK